MNKECCERCGETEQTDCNFKIGRKPFCRCHLPSTTLEEGEGQGWDVRLGELIGGIVAGQGVTRPLPNLERFVSDCKIIMDYVSDLLSKERKLGEAEGKKKMLELIAKHEGWEDSYRYYHDKYL